MSTKKTTKTTTKLKPAQVRFVHLFLGSEGGHCFNNATKAYITAYKVKNVDDKKVPNPQTGEMEYSKAYNSARAQASKLVTNGNIRRYISEILEEIGIDPKLLQRELGKLILQDCNLSVKLSAINLAMKVSGLYSERSTIEINALDEVGRSIRNILEGKSDNEL